MTFKKGKPPKGAKLFKKGESGNPKGRPRGKTMSTIIKELGEQLTPKQLRDSEEVRQFLTDNGKAATNSEVLAVMLWHKALNKKDLKAIREILDRLEGRPVSQINANVNNVNALDEMSDEQIIELLEKKRKRLDG